MSMKLTLCVLLTLVFLSGKCIIFFLHFFLMHVTHLMLSCWLHFPAIPSEIMVGDFAVYIFNYILNCPLLIISSV